MINQNDTLGGVAATHPASTQVFLRHRLDFCCGGNTPLGEACSAAGLDPDAVIEEIAALDEKISLLRWDSAPLSDLIEFILTNYHEPLRLDLPALVAAAVKVERVHGNKTTCPNGLASDLVRMRSEILEHLAKEEQILFPAIVAGGRGARIHMPVRVMMQEHEDHGANLIRLREFTNDFRPPREACATWRALYEGLERLESELMEHIHLENNVLFRRSLNA